MNNMLDKYIESSPLMPVPRCNGIYWINTEGVLLEKNSDHSFKRIMTEDGYVSIFINGKYDNVRLANLVQLTFKPVFDDDFEFYLHADILHIDGYLLNCHASNLIWNFTNSHVTNGFYRIPGYSRFLINKDGIVYNRQKDYYPNINYTSRDYVLVYAYPDHKCFHTNTNAAVHRLMALGFIKYGSDVCVMDVNHKDGNKHNFSIENLEWVTRSENIAHAISTGLTTDIKGVRVTVVSTGQTMEFPSQSACSNELGICGKLLSWRLREGKGKAYGDYIFESLAEPTTKHRTSPKSVIILNTVTKEVVDVDSLAKAASIVGMTTAALKKRYGRNALTFGKWKLFVWSPHMGETRPNIVI